MYLFVMLGFVGVLFLRDPIYIAPRLELSVIFSNVQLMISSWLTYLVLLKCNNYLGEENFGGSVT